MKLSSVVNDLAWKFSSSILFFNIEVSVELILAAKWHHNIPFYSITPPQILSEFETYLRQKN